jgi:hypothetical protein
LRSLVGELLRELNQAKLSKERVFLLFGCIAFVQKALNINRDFALTIRAVISHGDCAEGLI